MRFFRSSQADIAQTAAPIHELSADDITQVGGGCLGLIVLCVACALLLAHD